MIRAFALVIGFAAMPGLSACGNSEEDCEPICEWWQQYCTGETFKSCMNDCEDADEEADDVESRCVDGNGWGTPSNCQSASCCVKFVYEDYYYNSHC